MIVFVLNLQPRIEEIQCLYMVEKKKIQNFLRCAYSYLYLMETRNNIEWENINLLLV